MNLHHRMKVSIITNLILMAHLSLIQVAYTFMEQAVGEVALKFPLKIRKYTHLKMFLMVSYVKTNTSLKPPIVFAVFTFIHHLAMIRIKIKLTRYFIFSMEWEKMKQAGAIRGMQT